MKPARATRLSKALARAGFIALGGFHPVRQDGVPEVCAGEPTRTLLLIGSIGPLFFRAFSASIEAADGGPDPLDRYTARLLREMAGEFGFTPVFPFDGPPWHPFQQWAMKAGGFSRSPMGVLAHKTYGPWAGFRAAFLSAEHFGTFEANGTAGPCETCLDKPCLAACPVEAISLERGYDVPRCRDHLRGNPGAGCFAGCLARRACPFGQDFAQGEDQAGYHMRAFVEGGL